jgi:hypothetical protein
MVGPMTARPSPWRGRHCILLAAVAASLAAPVAPASASILFSTGTGTSAPGSQRLFLARDDGTHRTQIAKGRQALSISPNGRWGVAINSDFRLVLIDLRTRRGRVLKGLGVKPGAWARNSSRFLALGPSGLYAVDPARPTGAGRRLITPDGDVTITRGAFSPSGRMVVFTRVSGTSSTDVWRENVNGTGRRRLTSGGVSTSAAWGSRGIAYARLDPRPGAHGEDLHQVWLMRADGSHKRKLSHRTPPAGTRGYAPQEWLPNGRALIATLVGGGTCVAQRVDGSTGTIRSLSTSPLADAFGEGVSKDSRYLLALTGDPCGSGRSSTLRRIPIGAPAKAKTLAQHVFSAAWNH